MNQDPGSCFPQFFGLVFFPVPILDQIGLLRSIFCNRRGQIH